MKLRKGENDLATLRPDLCEEWDWENNPGKTPAQFTIGSGVKINWVCKVCGHKWSATIVNRACGRGCPCCSGKVLVPGRNDLASQRPWLVNEWAHTNTKHPEEVLVHSNHPADWKCSKCGHLWSASIASRSRGSGCPCCAGMVLIPGRNDLASQRPDLVPEWAESNTKSPNEVFVNSKKPADWKCSKCGHLWSATINHRSQGSGCPCCAGRVLVPGRNDLASQRPDLVPEWAESNTKSPNEVFVGSPKSADWKCSRCGHLWSARIGERSRGRGCPCCSGKVLVPGRNDLASQRPWLVNEWAHTNTKHPEEVLVHSNHPADWKCSKCGHLWSASIASRSHGRGCPCCAGMVLIPGRNDLASQRPDLVPEWAESNTKSPNEVFVNSKKPADWKCSKCGHLWSATIVNRAHGSRCPCCAGRVLVPGRNDLASQRPDLVPEWAESNTKSPNEVFVNSKKPADWKCSKCGHLWSATINHRSPGGGCPCCAGRVLIPGRNDLASQRPDLVPEWAESNTKSPNEVFVGSPKSADWKCSRCGHLWSARINSRVRGNKCPACNGRRSTIKRTVI